MTAATFQGSQGTEAILTRLDAVREIGRGRWLARCPSHEDGRPSLSIDEAEDGKTLLICRAGCATADVLAALGLEWSALFPRRPAVHTPNGSRPAWRLRELQLALNFECTVAFIILSDAEAGRALTDSDLDRAWVAARRIRRFRDELPSLRRAPIAAALLALSDLAKRRTVDRVRLNEAKRCILGLLQEIRRAA